MKVLCISDNRYKKDQNGEFTKVFTLGKIYDLDDQGWILYDINDKGNWVHKSDFETYFMPLSEYKRRNRNKRIDDILNVYI